MGWIQTVHMGMVLSKNFQKILTKKKNVKASFCLTSSNQFGQQSNFISNILGKQYFLEDTLENAMQAIKQRKTIACFWSVQGGLGRRLSAWLAAYVWGPECGTPACSWKPDMAAEVCDPSTGVRRRQANPGDPWPANLTNEQTPCQWETLSQNMRWKGWKDGSAIKNTKSTFPELLFESKPPRHPVLSEHTCTVISRHAYIPILKHPCTHLHSHNSQFMSIFSSGLLNSVAHRGKGWNSLSLQKPQDQIKCIAHILEYTASQCTNEDL